MIIRLFEILIFVFLILWGTYGQTCADAASATVTHPLPFEVIDCVIDGVYFSPQEKTILRVDITSSNGLCIESSDVVYSLNAYNTDAFSNAWPIAGTSKYAYRYRYVNTFKAGDTFDLIMTGTLTVLNGPISATATK
jgi:hypothetical protein